MHADVLQGRGIGIIGRGEDLLIGADFITLTNRDTSKEWLNCTFKCFTESKVFGKKLNAKEVSVKSHGTIRGEVGIICSHNRLFLTGSAENILSSFCFPSPSPSSSAYKGTKTKNDIVLSGSFNSIRIENKVFDLEGTFDTIDSLPSISLIGKCNDAIAYNGLYHSIPSENL